MRECLEKRTPSRHVKNASKRNDLTLSTDDLVHCRLVCALGEISSSSSPYTRLNPSPSPAPSFGRTRSDLIEFGPKPSILPGEVPHRQANLDRRKHQSAPSRAVNAGTPTARHATTANNNISHMDPDSNFAKVTTLRFQAFACEDRHKIQRMVDDVKPPNPDPQTCTTTPIITALASVWGFDLIGNLKDVMAGRVNSRGNGWTDWPTSYLVPMRVDPLNN